MYLVRYSSGSLNQRDQSRTQLFGSFQEFTDNESNPVSAYGNNPRNQARFDYSQATLAQLESQSTEQNRN